MVEFNERINFNKTAKIYIVYVYIFPDKCVYVGLTRDENRRHKDHFRNVKSQVFKHIERTGLTPHKLVLYSDLQAKTAVNLEIQTEEDFKTSGYITLNVARCGSLGSNEFKWSDEMIKGLALKCKSQKEFEQRFSKAFSIARKRKIMKFVCAHMVSKRKPNGYWTYERYNAIAKTCDKSSDMEKRYPDAYSAAKRDKNLGILTYNGRKKRPRKLTTEFLTNESKKYKTKNEFNKKDNSAYNTALRRGLIDILFT